MSYNTSQIMLKKLMKEVENAIRAADIQDKDSLDIREFKQCLFNLNYCQTMQMKEHSNEKRVIISQNSTARKILKTEEDFVHNLWELMNPLKKVLVNNALIYDILIHLIYDMNASTPQQISDTIRTYLQDTYSDPEVDLISIKRMLIENNSNLIESNEMTPSSLEGQDFKSQRDKEA